MNCCSWVEACLNCVSEAKVTWCFGGRRRFNHHLSHWGDRSLGTEQQWCLYGTQYLDRILFHASAPEGLDFGEKTNGKLIHQCHLCGMKGEIVLPFHCCFVRNMIFLWVAVQIVLSRVDFWQHFDKFKTFQRSETLSQPWNFMQLLTPKTS